MLYVTGIIITFFLSLLLITKKEKTPADQILACWLLTIGINLFLFYLHLTNLHYQYPLLLGLGFPLPLLHGPLLYLYVRTLASKSKLSYRDLLHFIPFVISLLLFSEYYFLPAETKIAIFRNKGAGYEVQSMTNMLAIMLSGIAYVFLSGIKLRNYKRTFKNEFSYTEKINLDWLKYLITGMAAIWLVVLSRAGDTYIFATVALFVIFIGYFGIRQVGIFSQAHTTPAGVPSALPLMERDDPRISDSEEDPANGKYRKSPLSEEAALKIHERLRNTMHAGKLFKNPELTLSQLAEALDTHPNYLSQVINTFEKKNFYEYINEQRVREFIKEVALPENRSFTILSLAFDCGFNSKTSFNRNFKKVTGLSPSEYLNQGQTASA